MGVDGAVACGFSVGREGGVFVCVGSFVGSGDVGAGVSSGTKVSTDAVCVGTFVGSGGIGVGVSCCATVDVGADVRAGSLVGSEVGVFRGVAVEGGTRAVSCGLSPGVGAGILVSVETSVRAGDVSVGA